MSGELSEAHAAIEEAVAAENHVAAEAAAAAVENIAAEAAERIEQAEAVAQALTEAAMLSRLGEQIEEIRREQFRWQENLATIQAEMVNLRSSLQEVEKLTAAVAALEMASQTPVSSLLTPPPSIAEATETVAEQILPENLANAVVESPAPETLRKRRASWI